MILINVHEVYYYGVYVCRETEESKKFSFKSLQRKEVCHNIHCYEVVFTTVLQQFFTQEEKKRNEVAMYETVNDPSHTPVPYERGQEVTRHSAHLQ